MKKLLLVVALACASTVPLAAADKDVAGWEKQAQRVTLIRDDSGHRARVGQDRRRRRLRRDVCPGGGRLQPRRDELYLNSIGRLAEAEGEAEIYRDLRMKLFIDPADMKAQHQKSPEWLKALMNAYADGLNYYLYKHPGVKPRVITHFEPWMALTFSEGALAATSRR